MSKWNNDTLKEFIKNKSTCKYISYSYYGKGQIKLKLICNCGKQFERGLSSAKKSIAKFDNIRCKDCSQKIKSKLITKDFEDVKNEIMNDKRSNTILISTKETYGGSKEKLIFICECGNDFERCYYDYFKSPKGCFCLRCSYKKRASVKKPLYEKVKKEFEKRGYLLLSKDYVNNTQHLSYICSLHKDKGNQTISWSNFHNHKKGCVYCGRESTSTKRLLTDDKVRGTLQEQGFEPLEPFVFKGYHSPFYAKNKDGYILKIHYGNLEKMQARIFHKGNKYTIHNIGVWLNQIGETSILLSNKYENARYDKLKWKCDKGHTFHTTWDNFKRGKRCPVCNESKGQKEIGKFLDKLNVTYKAEFRIEECKNLKPLPFDYAIFNNDTSNCNPSVLVEFDGLQHFYPVDFWGGSDGLKDNMERDQIKNNFCKINNIPLIRIPYWELSNIQRILQDIMVYIDGEDKNIKIDISNYLVNHPDWSHSKYIEKDKKEYIS